VTQIHGCMVTTMLRVYAVLGEKGKEDGEAGAEAAVVGGRAVSPELLQSVAEVEHGLVAAELRRHLLAPWASGTEDAVGTEVPAARLAVVDGKGGGGWAVALAAAGSAVGNGGG
jgi:hypothetical protein